MAAKRFKHNPKAKKRRKETQTSPATKPVKKQKSVVNDSKSQGSSSPAKPAKPKKGFSTVKQRLGKKLKLKFM